MIFFILNIMISEVYKFDKKTKRLFFKKGEIIKKGELKVFLPIYSDEF